MTEPTNPQRTGRAPTGTLPDIMAALDLLEDVIMRPEEERRRASIDIINRVRRMCICALEGSGEGNP